MSRKNPVRVSYEQQTFNAQNPLVRYAHANRARKSLSLVLKHLSNEGALLDFGAGEGHILSLVHQQYPEANLYAVELKKLPQPFIKQVDNLTDISQGTLDVITSFEVCEHLYESEIEQLISDAHFTLKPKGKLILSVPIMYGLALLPKEVNKMLLYHRGADYSFSELTSAVLGRSIQRPADPRHTHKGFDFRWLQKKLEVQFKINQKFYSPLPLLPWSINSQCFWVCQPKF